MCSPATTAILAAMFFVTSLVLSILAGMDRKPRSILDSGAPAAPTAPAAPARRLRAAAAACSIQLRGGAPQPAQPPAGPQVPRSQ